MEFIPPPINDSSKYQDQLQNNSLESIYKHENALDYIMLFGEKRPFNIISKKLPDPLFIDSSVKLRLKKLVRCIYEKMIESLKFCAGEMPINYGGPLPKIAEKSHEFMMLCEQAQVA